MSRIKRKLLDFNEKTGTAICILSYKGNLFEGKAQCCEDDMDMCSGRVGMQYAEIRANIEVLKFRRKELKTRFMTLEGVLKNLITSKDFDIESSYSNKLQSSICEAKIEYFEIKLEIEELKELIKNDIIARETFYSKIRERRRRQVVINLK